MNQRTSFEEDRLEAARAFAQTMIVVDDEAGDDVSHANEQTDAERRQVAEPGRGDARIAKNDRESDGKKLSNPLNRKVLIESALNLGIVCAVVKPNKKQTVARRVAKAAKCADIVSLDWQMNDHGDKALSIIREIVQRDERNGGRLRLIAIYTGDKNWKQIFKKILNNTPNKHNLREHRDGDQTVIVSDNGLRLVWLFKSGGITLTGQEAHSQVSEADLADRLLDEFSKLSEGMLANVALATISAIRDATHRALGKFTSRMDGPYLHHRAFIHSPGDAQDYAVSIVLSELKKAVDRKSIGQDYAGRAAIENYLNLMLNSDELRLHYKDGNDEEKKKSLPKNLVIEAIINGWNSSDNIKGLVKEQRAKNNFTSIFFDDLENGKEVMKEFAVLTGVQSDPVINSYGQKPHLTLGSIIRSTEKKYLLSLQAVCDSVRLGKGNSFFFVPLEEVEKDAEHYVPLSDGVGFIGLKAVPNAYTQAQSLSFKIEGDQVVYAKELPGASGYWFTTIEGGHFEWIANLKTRRAMRTAQKVSQKFTRIGFDEFEPFRRKD